MDTEETPSQDEYKVTLIVDALSSGSFLIKQDNKTGKIDIVVNEGWTASKTAEEIIRLINERSRQRVWNRIPDKIPSDQQLCLIVEEFRHHSVTDLAVYYEERSIFRQWQGFRQWPVEHVKYWMPIPEVPSERQKL